MNNFAAVLCVTAGATMLAGLWAEGDEMKKSDRIRYYIFTGLLFILALSIFNK